MELQAIKSEQGLWHIEPLEAWTITFDNMVKMLQDNQRFKFARYGDGEIYCMNGKKGQNCDNHTYFPDLSAALRQTVREEPAYMVGIQPLSVSHLPEDVEHYFGKFKTLYNADVLHNASIAGMLRQFTRAMRDRYIILVGPHHLAGLFPECVHIVIPSENCWMDYERVRQDIAFHVDGVNNAIVLLCASMMSEVIISWFEDFHHTFIDCGSVFDPYVGVKSRKYHHKLKI